MHWSALCFQSRDIIAYKASMNTNAVFLSMETRRILSLAILVSFFALFLPPLVTYADEPPLYPYQTYNPATGAWSAPGAGTAAGAGTTAAFKPAADTKAATDCSAWPASKMKPCFTWSFFGMYLASGICVAENTCQATAVTPLGGLGMGVVSAVTLQTISKMLSGGGTGSSGSSLNPYTSTNPYGAAGCTGTRYISPTPTSDPCGVYIPTTPTTNPNINLNPIGGGSTTVVTSGPVAASLTVVPTSGGAPLAVTFTVTDTSAACAHAAVSLSAGDGTAPITAIPATTACTTHTPVTFTYTYGTPGTYNAAITDKNTLQVLQSVTVTVTGGTTGAATSATLSVAPTSGMVPLAVTFTVTDTSAACSHAAITLSAGDGTAPVTAIPVTISCTGRTPQVFTYSYKTAGSYVATITDSGTGQVLQAVPVTVSGTTAPGDDTTNAALTVVPTSGSAPLEIMFTVTDTSSVCPRSEIALSAGDGSAPVTALQATAQCVGRAPAQFTYTYTKAGTYKAEIANMNTRQVLQSVTVTVGVATAPTDTTNATLTVAPESGAAPLNVKFTITDISASCPRSEIALSAGDGSAPVTALPATVTCIGITPAVLNYTYRNAGTFTAAIGNPSTQKIFQGVVVTVTPGNANTTPPPLTAPLTTPTASTVNVSSSLLNLTNSAGNVPVLPRTATITVQSGTWGDIEANASGVTITAGAHDKDGRTGVGGFYGYDTVSGVQPLDLARQMCAARPWTRSSATTIIPPSFYDSICTARGYKTSTALPATSAGTGAGTSKSSAPASTAKPPTKTATTSPAKPVAPAVPPKVYITAVPSSVKLGSRTSIFWNAVGVKSCLITSPDGSFGGNTLYGAASTVALTGETVFSIVCIKPDDSQISNFVKVKLAI